MTIGEVKEEEITNKEARRRFGGCVTIKEVWKQRQLLFSGRLARLDKRKNPPTLLTNSMEGKILRGRPFRTIRDALLMSSKVQHQKQTIKVDLVT